MLLLTNAPTWVFHTQAEAGKAAAELASGETEGWTYTVVLDPMGSGRCTIDVRDEDGEFVSKLTN
ncbi:MAG: hypothetical protein WC326_15380 [Candidatus Delongbacteria bacterium]